jgi:PTH2 family peptidyl-tRNA hydrolase
MENKVKQVIVMRKDLKNTKGEKVRSGKIISQGCHASMKVLVDEGEIELNAFGDGYQITIPLTNEQKEWLEGQFTKICLRVDSEEELMDIYNKAKALKLPCALIEDSGLTEFDGVITKTCIAIGPADSDAIDVITGHLKLF